MLLENFGLSARFLCFFCGEGDFLIFVCQGAESRILACGKCVKSEASQIFIHIGIPKNALQVFCPYADTCHRVFYGTNNFWWIARGASPRHGA